MARLSRTPGLQIPTKASGDERAFFDAVRERLQLLSGERGDSDASAVTRGDLRTLRESLSEVIRITATNTEFELDPESFDFGQFPEITLSEIEPGVQFLIQGTTAEDKWRFPVADLFNMFTRRDIETILGASWVFAAPGYGFDIRDDAPRIRFVEEPLNDGVEVTLPADSTIWDWYVDTGVMSLRARDDLDSGGAVVFNATRTGTNIDNFDVLADALEHNGVQVITTAGAGLDKDDDTLSVLPYQVYEADLGSLPRFSGVFDITGFTGLTANTPVLAWQAAAAYTNKGTLLDESEMDLVRANGYVLDATTVRISWVADPSNGPVVGNVKFNYWIGT